MNTRLQGARVINQKRLLRIVNESRNTADDAVDLNAERPRTRGDCIDMPRPCPFVGCAHHLYLDVNEDGAIKLNFPNKEPWELTETCALDVADRGGETLIEVGRMLNVSRERIRQIEERQLRRLKRDQPHLELPVDRPLLPDPKPRAWMR